MREKLHPTWYLALYLGPPHDSPLDLGYISFYSSTVGVSTSSMPLHDTTQAHGLWQVTHTAHEI